MKAIVITPEEVSLARTYIDWFPSFCISSAYDASMDWPEKAWTAARAIEHGGDQHESQIHLCNDRARAWVTARAKLIALRTS